MPDKRPPVITVASPKGGVGKTTVVANIAAAMAQAGQRPLLLDLDPQNASRLYHRMPLDDERGLAVQSLRGEPWADAIFEGPFGVDCLPYGILTEADRRGAEALIEDDPDWLENGIRSLPPVDRRVIVIDTPPGGTLYLPPSLSVADVVMFVLLPDAASFVTLPTMKRWLDEFPAVYTGDRKATYLLNRMNAARSLCRDVHAALEDELGAQLIPHVVHFDTAVEEALASQQPVSEYAPDSLAAKDFRAVADWVLQKL